MKPIQTTRSVLHFNGEVLETIEDVVVTEYALTIKVNGEEFATVVCTPKYMEDMVIGFLASEGVIRSERDIQQFYIEERGGFAQIKVENINQFYQSFKSKRYITSCCGMTRQGFYFVNDAMTAKDVRDVKLQISIAQCFHLMNKMQEGARLFQETGGVHTAALCDKEDVVIARTDIGRHNALDKIYGYCLRNDISLDGKILVFSGRLSSEILLKVSKIGCAVVLSKSAPTELALQIAEQQGITTVGFIRGRSLNVYTHPERIVDSILDQ